MFLAIATALSGLCTIVVAILWHRAREDAHEADCARHNAEKQLQETSREFIAYKKRTRKQISDLKADIESLEDDLGDCASPGARRARLERLLSKTTALEG